jgi:hypothetical protein
MKRLALLAALPLLAAACSTKTPPPQFAWDHAASFAAVKTWAWLDEPPFKYPQGGGMVDGRFIDEHVRRAVEKDLAKKGYTKAEGGTPDVFVMYHTSQDGILDHDTWGRYNWWSAPIYVTSNYYKEGTLAIDVRGPDKKLQWRGVISGTIGRNPEELADKIDWGVDQLLSKFPPAPGS